MILISKKDQQQLIKWKSTLSEDATYDWITEVFDPSDGKNQSWILTPNISILICCLVELGGSYFGHQMCAQHPFLLVILLIVYQLTLMIGLKKSESNYSQITELLSHVCDHLMDMFAIIVCMTLFGVESVIDQWLILQIVQLTYITILLLEIEIYPPLFCSYLFIIVSILMKSSETLQSIFLIGIFMFFVMRFCSVTKIEIDRIKDSLSFVLLSRVIRFLWISTKIEPCFCHVLMDGLVLSMVMLELHVSKMANRELHPLVAIFTLITAFDESLILSFLILFFYHIILFSEISQTLNLPILSSTHTIYIDGVYDLMHYGHMNVITKAKICGNCLIVGLVTDQDCVKYKRLPILSYNERYKYVDAYLKNCQINYKIVVCPYPEMDVNFIEKYHINTILCSEEYDPLFNQGTSKFYDYYKVPRDYGVKIDYIPRTQGISTSDIIDIIKNRKDL